ncbi:hypothetical protein LGH70_16230 [Hymenobacter sp. BT635]|uniref:HTH cro/C1-type domain-containing protein n=1 Tax=Hymenobacter nitidus TaxID=2880929 RepID=A0ABS8AFD5_9BACT|nr:hypothetical protein [Hymenobacter nitidus]MCB2379150.1 hypothetical protein [Hymenobacter nitidus]
MSQETRAMFGLTQELMASWLGVPRASLALAERNHQYLKSDLSTSVQGLRLYLAGEGKVLDMSGVHATVPPLSPPAPEPKPLERRLRDCQYQLLRLRRDLEAMQKKAAQLERRLVALPALRAWAGEVKNPAREENWLALFEGEAVSGLLYDCGAGPQKLLETRIAGLERELCYLRTPRRLGYSNDYRSGARTTMFALLPNLS